VNGGRHDPGGGWTCRFCKLAVLCALLSAAGSLLGQENPQSVEVHLGGSRTLSLPGASQVVVLDESICRVELLLDSIRLFGLTRGESVVFVWVGEKRINWLVRVVPPPVATVRPSLSRGEREAMGQGAVSTTSQVALTSRSQAVYSFLHHFDWSQQSDGRRLTIRGESQDSSSPGVHAFNFNSGSVQYATPNSTYNFLDFVLTLNGGGRGIVTAFPQLNTYAIRGADVVLNRGANQFEFFGGATIPSFYLSLAGTRDIGGLNFSRKQSDNLYLYSTTAAVSVPLLFTATSARRNGFFQTAGFAYHFNHRWATQFTGGASSRGLFGQGTVSFVGNRLSAWATGTSSAPDFPLNELQLLFGGGSSVLAGTTWKANPRLLTSLFCQHGSTRPTELFPSFRGISDYLNPNINFTVTRSQTLTLNYVHSRNRGGLTLDGQSIGNRIDVGLSSQLPRHIVNNAELSLGTSADPQELSTRSLFSLRDNVSMPVKGGFLTAGFQHDRQDPSLVARLRQEIDLLPIPLQQLFFADPVSFVQSVNLPPDLRQWLAALQPADTQFSVSGQFHVGRKLNISPNYSFLHSSQFSTLHTNTSVFGYALNYQLTPALQLRSSLSNTMLFDPRQKNFARTTVLTVGLNKTFNGTPRWLVPSTHRYRIEGRVFRDMNVNGGYNQGEPGLAGIVIRLSGGRSTMTDDQGRFQFAQLRPGSYRLVLPLEQFHDPVRLTTASEVPVEIYEQRVASVDFGIVNFSRLMGNVFNDYAHDRLRQADAPGVHNVALIVASADGFQRKVLTDGAGDYEIDDLAPGQYQLAADLSTIPPNYVLPDAPVNFEVKPTATVVQDVPVRALRSIAGRVYLKLPPPATVGHEGKVAVKVPGGQEHQLGQNGTSGEGKPVLVPLAGVQLTADHNVVTTDTEGRFILRNLPAGDLLVTLLPVRPLPPGMQVPAGTVPMPKGPIQIDNAVIVITNPALLQYLLVIPPKVEVPTATAS